jgi:hypothetical protein
MDLKLTKKMKSMLIWQIGFFNNKGCDLIDITKLVPIKPQKKAIIRFLKVLKRYPFKICGGSALNYLKTGGFIKKRDIDLFIVGKYTEKEIIKLCGDFFDELGARYNFQSQYTISYIYKKFSIQLVKYIYPTMNSIISTFDIIPSMFIFDNYSVYTNRCGYEFLKLGMYPACVTTSCKNTADRMSKYSYQYNARYECLTFECLEYLNINRDYNVNAIHTVDYEEYIKRAHFPIDMETFPQKIYEMNEIDTRIIDGTTCPLNDMEFKNFCLLLYKPTKSGLVGLTNKYLRKIISELVVFGSSDVPKKILKRYKYRYLCGINACSRDKYERYFHKIDLKKIMDK